MQKYLWTKDRSKYGSSAISESLITLMVSGEPQLNFLLVLAEECAYIVQMDVGPIVAPEVATTTFKRRYAMNCQELMTPIVTEELRISYERVKKVFELQLSSQMYHRHLQANVISGGSIRGIA